MNDCPGYSVVSSRVTIQASALNGETVTRGASLDAIELNRAW